MAIADVPITPRQTWFIGFCVLKPIRNSLRIASQTTITGMAKRDRKKTDCPGGTWPETDLMIPAMTTKRSTDNTLKMMARKNCIGRPCSRDLVALNGRAPMGILIAKRRVLKTRRRADHSAFATMAPATFSDTMPKTLPTISETAIIIAALPSAAVSVSATPVRSVPAAVDA